MDRGPHVEGFGSPLAVETNLLLIVHREFGTTVLPLQETEFRHNDIALEEERTSGWQCLLAHIMISACETWAVKPVSLLLDFRPVELGANKFVLFEGVQFVVICDTAIEN